MTEQTTRAIDRRFAVAPMMGCTDRHGRYLLRLISRHALLYTEMVSAGALVQGDARRLLLYHPAERPLALQIGGSDPGVMASCAQLAGAHGFDEINLNIGCPSDRVQSGRFGACLMAEPALVARCVRAMREATDLPVTVKTRVGVDEHDSYAELSAFVNEVAGAGCRVFIVHARKAWLRGLSPKENREVPPLRHDLVHHLKRDFPALEIVLNGGVTTLTEALHHLRSLDGVMLGREAYRNPYLLAQVDRDIFGDGHAVPGREEIVERYVPYVEQQLADGARLSHMTRHLLGLFQGVPGARAWRRHLSGHAHVPGADTRIIHEALGRTSHALPTPSLSAQSHRSGARWAAR